MKTSQLSLKWLDVFVATVRTGSVQDAATETGLSTSTASHHLKQLETTMGAALFDHTRRPMRVTAAGAAFHREIDAALRLIRRAEARARAGDLMQTGTLSLGLIEDFDTDIAPELARLLTEVMPNCRFRHLTRTSRDVLGLLRNEEIEIGVAARPEAPPPDLIEAPLLRDPFVLARPANCTIDPDALMQGSSDLPFLRYAPDQLMARQIEAQLQRLKRALHDSHVFDSNQTMLRLIAEGAGWTITTPINYMRARPWHRQIRLSPFPGRSFARQLSVFSTELTDPLVTQSVVETLRRLVHARAVAPAVADMPWLSPDLRVLEPGQ